MPAVDRYDWEKIVEICKDLISTAGSLTALTGAVNARIGREIPSGTLSGGLARRLGLQSKSFSSLVGALSEYESDLSPMAATLLRHIRGRGARGEAFSLLSLCETFDRSPGSVMAAVEELQDADFYVKITDDRRVVMPEDIEPTFTKLPVELWTKPARIHRYGIVSDCHLANRTARLGVLEALYDIFVEEGIETVLVPGNLIDGESRYNRHELLAHGVEGQIAFCAKYFPHREGITTKFITADEHEGWYAKDIGLDIGRRMGNGFIERGREDLVWIGHVERDLSLFDDNPDAVLRLMHPGGGTAYAISYKPQKIIEGFQGGEKPEVLLLGHYHKEGKFYMRNVNVVMCATTADQSMFMRKRPLGADVGGSIIEIHLSPMGAVTRFRYEFFPFFDKGYYKKWDYASMFDLMT